MQGKKQSVLFGGFGGPGGGPFDPGRNSMQNAGVFASGARMATSLVAETMIWAHPKKGTKSA